MFDEYEEERLKEIDDQLNESMFFVRATDFEYHMLWCFHFHDNKFVDTWTGGGVVYYLDIGRSHGEDVVVSLCFASINGKPVCFYGAGCQFVDEVLIRKWLEKTTKDKKWDKKSLMGDGKTYGRPAYCDVWNFHDCIAATKE